jgi:SWI/SNF-related matrix-associated actin-dependent regulator of chromatin subfamily A3
MNQLTSKGILYINPHNPPPGGWGIGRSGVSAFMNTVDMGTNSGMGPQNNGMNGVNGTTPGMHYPGATMGFNSARWQPHALNNMKSVEVQRSQATDAVFSSLRSGEELSETDVSDGLIRTPLYPHQKKALTFLLEREGEREGGSKFWKVRGGLGDVGESLGVQGCEKGRNWVNVVTNKEVTEEPKECKGTLLADDVSIFPFVNT